jgi:hypothetical protein
MLAEANRCIGYPYVWGGGHGTLGVPSGGPPPGFDCSGYVSAILGAGGYLTSPQTTQSLESQSSLASGAGLVTVWDAYDEHVIINVAGQWFASRSPSEGGPQKISAAQGAATIAQMGMDPYHPANMTGSAQSTAGGSSAGTSSTVTLAQLWTDNGGPQNQARTAAAVAMAESGGNTQAVDHDSDGSTDYGLWQINSVHGYDSARLLSDPDYNAKAAVSVYSGSGWGAWTTYTSGAYMKYMGVNGPRIAASIGGTPAAPITRPGGSAAADTGASVDALFTDYGTQTDAANATGNPATMASGPVGDPTTTFASDHGPLNYLFGGGKGSLYNNLEQNRKTIADAIKSPLDFLKWIGWIFHPNNVLRAIEFLAGLGIMFLGLSNIMKQSTGTGPVGAVAASPVGKVVNRTVEMTPQGRAIKSVRLGRQTEKAVRRRDTHNANYRKGRTQAAAKANRPKRQSRRSLRQQNKADPIPF